jgi:hypothetical protein
VIAGPAEVGQDAEIAESRSEAGEELRDVAADRRRGDVHTRV